MEEKKLLRAKKFGATGTPTGNSGSSVIMTSTGPVTRKRKGTPGVADPNAKPPGSGE